MNDGTTQDTEPPANAETLPNVLVANIKAARKTLAINQERLAMRMESLGHGWTQTTVSQVEHRKRAVTVNELGGLAVSLETSIVALLLPSADTSGDVNFGGPAPVPGLIAAIWIGSEEPSVALHWAGAVAHGPLIMRVGALTPDQQFEFLQAATLYGTWLEKNATRKNRGR